MAQIDWAKLVAQGRAKAIGVSWSPEELKARYEYNIPADYVRQGILTSEDYQKALAREKQAGVTPAFAKPTPVLLKEARDLGIRISPEVSKGVLVTEIEKKKAELAKKEKEAPAKVETPKPQPKAKDDTLTANEMNVNIPKVKKPTKKTTRKKK